MLYAFNKLANWERPAGGPLVIPTYDNPRKDESKECAIGQEWIAYLKRLNPDKTAFKHIVSEDYGPTKGYNAHGKLRFNLLVYPGNVVSIDKVVNGWGLLNTLSMNVPPSLSVNWKDHPHLIHKVYGATRNGGIQNLPHAPYVPVLGNSRW